ncbi:MAG: preprotein translocase subunit SecE [Candidatus Omnitrophota bacterium]
MGIFSLVKRVPTFVKETQSELKKVSWSTRKELTAATLIVLVASGVLTFYIAVVDLGLSRFIQWLIK